MSAPTSAWSLLAAQDWLRAHIDDGARCPCCTQLAKVYKRQINGAMVRALVGLYRASHVGAVFAHLPPIDPSHGDAAKLAYWGLIEEEPTVREDGGRCGWWRITPLGVDWLHARVTLPKYVRVYDGRLLSGPFGEPVSAQDRLGKRFDLRELMEGR